MGAAQQILLPNSWDPRHYQRGLWGYMMQDKPGLRADIVAHRRWGKDDVALHTAAVKAHLKVGTYWHMLPEAAQARKAIWDAINPHTGKRRIDEAFPKVLRETTREQEMFIRFKNGSTWQVVGSDNYNSLVGSPPTGVVFSEWALARPDAWGYIRPILLENGGWAMFIWTPRGRNHATRAFEAREKDPHWFTARMPATATGVFTEEQLAKELQEMIDEAGSVAEGTAKYNSEYLVDFDAPVPGSYFGDNMVEAEKDGRIGNFPWTRGIKVDTMWDLGIDDYTAIWFVQRISPTQFNIIDFYETSDLGLDGIVEEAFGNKGLWEFGLHYLPHDVAQRELGAGGRSRRQTLHMLGIRPIRVGVARDPEERINASRRFLKYAHFHKLRTETGIDHLKQYRKKWNQSMGVFTGPLHDEHSHAADAFGEGAVNMRLPEVTKEHKGTDPTDRWAKIRRTGEKSMFADGSAPDWRVV